MTTTLKQTDMKKDKIREIDSALLRVRVEMRKLVAARILAGHTPTKAHWAISECTNDRNATGKINSDYAKLEELAHALIERKQEILRGDI